jgi:hypothetical protein
LPFGTKYYREEFLDRHITPKVNKNVNSFFSNHFVKPLVLSYMGGSTVEQWILKTGEGTK